MTGPASNEINYGDEGWGDEPRAIHALMSGLIDYAGLFPPAKLSMDRCTWLVNPRDNWPPSRKTGN